MADRMKDQDNKDAQESGRPVQLDREEQQGGQPTNPEDTSGSGQKPGQPGQAHPNC